MTTPNIIAAQDAGVHLSDISEHATKVVGTLQENGFQAYLVGGCVRDLILQRKPKDFDVATDATPDQIKELFDHCRIIGRRFKLAHVRRGMEVIEVATFRAGAEDRERVDIEEMQQGDEGQLLRDNIYGSIEEDVLRRDFRANALYYDPIAQSILDFLGGIDDIKEKKLISIGDPKERFREDPVRMLRVVRFAAKLGFSMEQEALETIEEEGKLLALVSSARLFDEVLKLFHGGAAYPTYRMLREYGLFKYLFPFTEQCVDDDNEGMPEMALKNTDKRVAEGKPVIPAFLFACMMWDPVKVDAQVLMNDGEPESNAWRTAMQDALRDQNQYVAVPRRLAEIILDIWNIHFRLIKRNPRMVRTCLNARRFRAAYDFLLLRSMLHEVDDDIAEWWTKIQEVEEPMKDSLIHELGEAYSAKRQRFQGDGETYGNHMGYKSSHPYSRNSKRMSKNKSSKAKFSRKPGQHSKHRAGSSGSPTSTGNYLRANTRRQEKYNTDTHTSDGEDYYAQDGNRNKRPTTKKVKVRKKRRVLLKTGSEPLI